MTAIIDYGVGNLFSLQSSFSFIGENAIVTSDSDVIRSSDRVILPGVGAFSDAAKKLHDSGMWDVVISEAASGKPLMGICLGMQMLFEKSFEYGEHEGLCLIPGSVRPIAEVIPAGLKIPHIGWNALRFHGYSPLLKNIKDGDFVYFVHSYYAAGCENYTVADTDYGVHLTAVVQNKNVFGCQFHPEKSGTVGLNILRSFCEL